MRTKLANQTLTDPEGREIPATIINESRIRKHKLVEDIFEKAERIEEKMKQTKSSFHDKISQYKSWLLKKNKLNDSFENLTLSNYSGTKQIQILSHRVIEFDEKIQLAKQKIDACLLSWGKESHPHLKVLIDRLFKTNNNGMLNKNSVIGLFQYNIKDKQWNEAMNLIKESIVESHRKEYFILKKRNNSKDSWHTINLNFSSIKEEI